MDGGAIYSDGASDGVLITLVTWGCHVVGV